MKGDEMTTKKQSAKKPKPYLKRGFLTKSKSDSMCAYEAEVENFGDDTISATFSFSDSGKMITLHCCSYGVKEYKQRLVKVDNLIKALEGFRGALLKQGRK